MVLLEARGACDRASLPCPFPRTCTLFVLDLFNNPLPSHVGEGKRLSQAPNARPCHKERHGRDSRPGVQPLSVAVARLVR